ncbi:MAG: O-antigen polysaccharide polymerase Wzy [Bacteroidota bacterium]|jgi:oligosaccharide repeat unit polymerase
MRFFIAIIPLIFLWILGYFLGNSTLSIECRQFIWFYWFIALTFFSIKHKWRLDKIDPFSPAPVFILVLFFYSIASALLVEATGTNNYEELIPKRVLYEYYDCCLLGVLGFCLGCLIVSPKPKVIKRKIDKLDKNVSKIHAYAIVLGVLFFSFFYKSFNVFVVQSYAIRALDSRIERMQDKGMGIIDILVSNPPTMLILCSAVLLIFNKSKTLPTRLIALSVFSLYIATNFMAGWRSVVVSALVIPAIYYNYRVKLIPLLPTAIFGFLIYVFSSVSVLVRHLDTFSEMIAFMGKTYENVGFGFLNLDKSGELLTGTNLMRQIKGIQTNEVDYSYGTSIINELLVYIPRAIYPDRPLPLSEQFIDVFYPGVRESGGGYGFFCLQEGYWAFGMLGVFLFLFFYGWLLQRMYEWFRARFDSDYIVLMYTQFFIFMVVFSVRVGILGNIKAFLMYSIPFLILLPLPNLVFRKER